MILLGQLKNLMKRLGVKYYKGVAHELLRTNYKYFDDYFHDNRNPTRNPKIIESDEEQVKKATVKYKHNGKLYTFEMNELHEDDRRTFSVESSNGNTCILFFIAKDTKYAYIDNISYYTECAKEGLKYPGGGTVLLNFIMTYLKTNKQRLKITRIVLRDTSMKLCPGDEKIDLSIMYSLMYGDTWYGSYGFRPYNPIKEIPDIYLTKKYEKNQKIMNNAKVSSIPNLKRYILNSYDQTKPDDVDIKKIMKGIDTVKNEALTEFIRCFLSRYDIYCGMFEKIYIQIANDLKLYNFHGLSFYLDI